MKEAKERPIIFSAPMVKAILEGRKRQTRRVMDTGRFTNFDIDIDGSFVSWQDENGDHLKAHEFCPYGRPGDILWVRETWAWWVLPSKDRNIVLYAADDNVQNPRRWKSPTHMPRWASRIMLEIKDVRVKRVQEISVNDANEEGFPSGLATWNEGPGLTTGRGEFMDYWNKLNAKRGYGWDKNPWCWCISFEVMS